MFKILDTDFYQVSMVFVYGCLEEANKRVGFEAFVRNIKPEVAGKQDHYIFSGERELTSFLENIAIEVKNPILPYAIAGLISKKIQNDINKEVLISKFLKNAENFETDFEYSVYPEGSKVYPYVPVFQYKGPLWIGQLIETYVCNIINGKTGLESDHPVLDNAPYVGQTVKDKLGKWQLSPSVLAGYPSFCNEDCNYIQKLRNLARKYRESTSKVLLEAAFRRSPSLRYSKMASKIALEEGWNGTSNLALFFDNGCTIDQVGGTMAHSFIMSQRDEAEAYEKWNSVFKNPTVLIDTYDPVKAIDKLISKSIKPFAVRIDSDPLAEYAVAIREKLNNYGWNDVKIFISGDLTPEILREFEDRNIPFDMCMAGTKYANIGDFETINAGFVYKLVEVHDEYGIFYPEKKSIGKKNYSGLKRVEIYPDYIKVKKDWDGFGIRTFPEAEKPKDKVIFESWEDFA